MVRWFLASVLFGALISITGGEGAGAQQADQVRVSVDTQTYPRLQTTVTVLDGFGRPVTELNSQAFAVSVDGRPLPIQGLRTGQDPNAPAAVVLAFDTSGSMNEGDAIGQARQAGKALVSQLGPTDQVAVFTFSDSIQLVRDFTSDRGALIAAVDGITAAGNTALYDAVGAAVSTAARAPAQHRRAVVLLSDGKDEGSVSHIDRGGSLAGAQAAGFPFFAVGLGPSIDQAYLQDLTNGTHGQLLLAPSPQSLQSLYEAIGTTLRQQYILDVDASGVDAASAKTLRIEVNHAGTITGAEAPLDLSRFAPTPATTPPVTQPATPVVTAAATPAPGGHGGGSTFLLIAAGGLLAAALAGAGGAVYLLRRRRPAVPQELRTPWRPRPEDPGAVFVGTGPLGNMRADAWLESVGPENVGRFPLGEDPVTVGFTGDCTICLPDGAGLPGARFRVWRREGVYMLHNLSRLGWVTVGGKAATWAVLEDGDEIVIGASRLRFRMGDGGASA
ncbi:MAG: VWA domain-containing protein [Chloroflexi bacterium]|nr:MAG: VWA domain-containing protein [Chloroflexota bacterium]